MAANGAALSLTELDLHDLVIAADVSVNDHRMIYYTPESEAHCGVHCFDFDKATMPHALGVQFWKGGKFIAYLCPVAEASRDAVSRWEQWQRWLSVPANREHHAAAIAEEFESFESMD